MIITRFKYYLTKLNRAWSDGTFSERINRKIVTGTKTKIGTTVSYLMLPAADKKLSVSDGFADHRPANTTVQETDRIIFDRIINAYQLAKAEQAKAAIHFAVRGLWAEWIEVNYSSLIEGINRRDYARLNSLLSNFAREQFAMGTGSSYDDFAQYKTSLLGRFYIKSVWCEYRDKLLDIDADLSQISHPQIGNPAGISMNGQVMPSESLRHAYNAHSIANLLQNVSRPTVMEIGGGFGGQAYQTIEKMRRTANPPGKYLDFDIPEVLFVCGYFLLKAFPNARIRLYGEGNISASETEGFDIGLFPHFTMDSVSDLSVDLVFNSHSFSEMDGETSSHYLSIVNRICRRYFLHINHDIRLTFTYADGTASRNNLGSEMLPDERHFKRIYKRPRVYGKPEDKPFKSFAYLYERYK
jgi:putative sugar O-methyltransferase